MLNIDKMPSKERGQLEATLALVLAKTKLILKAAETGAKEEEVEIQQHDLQLGQPEATGARELLRT